MFSNANIAFGIFWGKCIIMEIINDINLFLEFIAT